MSATRPDRKTVSPAQHDAPRYRRARLEWQRAQGWTIGLVRSFGYAFSGIAQLIRRQRNAQIHLFLSAVACGAAFVWGLSRIEWLILVLTIAIVLSMEAINTALEAVVDLASPQFHPLAKQAKDVAAGGVLLAAIGALGVAFLLFGPHLLGLLRWLIG